MWVSRSSFSLRRSKESEIHPFTTTTATASPRQRHEMWLLHFHVLDFSCVIRAYGSSRAARGMTRLSNEIIPDSCLWAAFCSLHHPNLLTACFSFPFPFSCLCILCSAVSGYSIIIHTTTIIIFIFCRPGLRTEACCHLCRDGQQFEWTRCVRWPAIRR